MAPSSYEFFVCCGLVGALEGAHRILLIADDRDDATASWHLEDVVAVVRHRHELGEAWVPEDGVVREANVRDVKVDELGVVVFALAESDWEVNLPQGGGGAVGHP